jgi:hypothetical protein
MGDIFRSTKVCGIGADREPDACRTVEAGAVRWPDDWRLARATSKEMRALRRRARCPIRRQP